jgi:formylglycine-generating enzyme required for sulfatase activity
MRTLIFTACIVMILSGCTREKLYIVEDMLEVPEGSFIMGDSSIGSDAVPVHTVFLPTYYIDRYEVTNEEFAAFLNENKNMEREIGIGTMGCRIMKQGSSFRSIPGYENHPVTKVTWNGATQFAAWRSARLPTEAEWEKAARGTAGLSYPWGDRFLPDMTSCCGDSLRQIGSFPGGASPYGVMDMAGNAWEWVSDAWTSDYYEHSPEHDPAGPQFDGRYRVLRGGSHASDSNTMKCAYRGHHFPDKFISGVGFRCARDGF